MVHAEAPEPPPGVIVVDDTPAEPPLVPSAPDLLAGHLAVGASGGLLVPFGSFDSTVPARDAGLGLGGALDVSLGISRVVSVGVYGRYFAHRLRCDACRADTFAVGPFIAYHAAQGLRFDPWILVGAAYQRATLSESGRTACFSGLEWLRVALGGDYYAFSGVCLGPFVELNLGTFFARAGVPSRSTVHGAFLAGVRLGFDTPGR
jgi:hypothetical protein